MGTGLALDFDNGGAEVGLDDSGLPAVDDAGRPPLPDAETAPEAVNAITARVLASDEEEVAISGPPDGSVTLFAGYIDPDGNRWQQAEVRELRGRDEESMARAFATGDMTRYIDAIVRAGTVRIGEVEDSKELTKVLDTLLVGDRDMLVLQIRRLAYGDTIHLNVKCPFCEEKFEVNYSFSEDVPLKQFQIEGVGDYTQRQFDIDLPGGSVCEIRLTDGRAQKAVFTPENSKRTDAEINTLLLAELVTSIDGKTVRGVGPILDMAAKDRAHLLRWLTDNQPGPQYGDVKQECPDCMREFPLVMSLRDMFRAE